MSNFTSDYVGIISIWKECTPKSTFFIGVKPRLLKFNKVDL